MTKRAAAAILFTMNSYLCSNIQAICPHCPLLAKQTLQFLKRNFLLRATSTNVIFRAYAPVLILSLLLDKMTYLGQKMCVVVYPAEEKGTSEEEQQEEMKEVMSPLAQEDNHKS